MSQVKCVFPFSSLTIEPDGVVQLCPSSHFSLASLAGNEKRDLSSIWNGLSYQKIRDQFAQGQFPAECRNCKKAEQLGQLSRRQRIWERGYLFYGDEQSKLLAKRQEPKVLELNLSFSNKCNLKCAMCSSRYSHSWNEEEVEARSLGMNFREGKAEVNFSMDEGFFSSILKEMDSIQHLMIKGGEPFLAPQTFTLLEHLKLRVDQGQSIPSIYIQTNGSLTTERMAHLISDLEIEIGVSIDGVGANYEWIRGFSYERIEKNIEFFLNASKGEPLSLDFTASLFNVFTLVDDFKKLIERFEDHPNFYKINFTIARQPYNDLRALPQGMRQVIATKLREFKHRDKINNLEDLCHYIESEQLELSQQRKAYQWLSFLEQKRGLIPAREKYDPWIQEIANV